MPYENFQKLRVYQECRSFRIQISNIIKNKIPRSEKFILKPQLLRSSRSITANIAEGHGSYYHKAKLHYLRIARGSLNETLDHLQCALDEGYISDTDFKELSISYDSCMRLLNAYISHFSKVTNA